MYKQSVMNLFKSVLFLYIIINMINLLSKKDDCGFIMCLILGFLIFISIFYLIVCGDNVKSLCFSNNTFAVAI